MRAAGRGVAAARIVLPDAGDRLPPLAGEGVDQRRLADAGGADQRDGLPRTAPRREPGHGVSVARIEALDEEPGQQPRRGRDIGVRIVDEIGLGEHDERHHLGFAGEREVAFQPARR